MNGQTRLGNQFTARCYLHAAGVVIFSVLIACAAASAQPSFQGVGDLPGGLVRTDVVTLSGDGRTLVGLSSSADVPDAWVCWTRATGLTEIAFSPPHPSATILIFGGMSWDGGLIAATISFGEVGSQAALLRCDGGFEFVGPSGCYCQAAGMSDDGNAIAIRFTNSGNYAHYWTRQGGVIRFGPLPGTHRTWPRAVSGDGRVVVGGSEVLESNPGFRWSLETGMLPLGDLPGGLPVSSGTAASYDGSVIVGYSSSANNVHFSHFEAWRWTEHEGVVALGDLPGGVFNSVATGVSGGGDVIVGWGSTELGREAFIWDAAGGMRHLREVLITEYGLGEALEGWLLREPVGISRDGRVIAGNGLNPDGNREGWIVELGPPPPPCRVDFNGDQAVDSQDFFDFLNALFAGDPRADFDQDGAITSADFFAFLVAFFNGCP